MPTWTGTITLTEDDAAYTAGVMDPASVSRSLSTASSNYAFFRFRNVPIPRGATILSATLNVSLIFFSSGEAVMRPMLRDDVLVPLTADLIAPMGDPSPVYNAANGMVQSVTAQVQDLVNRPGWNPGQAFGFVAERYSGTVTARMVSADGLQYGAVLTVEYSEATPPGAQVASIEVSSEGNNPKASLLDVEVFTDAPEPIAGPAKVWLGDQYAEVQPHAWLGDSWAPVRPHVWTGDQWVPTS
jgi:hypothetical protein